MFPDTANFTDPTYTTSDPTADPLTTVDPADWSSEVGTNPGTGAGLENAYATGGTSSNTPAQGSSTGAQILGWLSLANNIAQTATSRTRTGYTTRPGVNAPSSLKATSMTTLLVILAVFVGAIFLLRE